MRKSWRFFPIGWAVIGIIVVLSVPLRAVGATEENHPRRAALTNSAPVNAAKKNLDYIRIRKGGACGPTLIGETVYLVNSHRKQKFKIKVKIRTESYQKDKVTEKWFIVGAKSELRIGCTVPQKGVKNVYTPTEANPVS